jgi:hypothetical protein
MNLVIGGPISRREWILDRWYAHVEIAAHNAGIVPRFLHVGNPDNDPETWAIISQRDPTEIIAVHTDEPRRDDIRLWPHARYQLMTELRNRGLAAVRAEQPDWFLSLDSDILLHPDAIVSLLDAVEGWDAVGGKCYMTDAGRREPSWGTLKLRGGIYRQDAEPGALFPCQVIMGIKLMSPAAYNIDYHFDTHGEDVGWAKAAQAARLRIRWDGRVVSKHVYNRGEHDKIDKRLGW